MLWRTCQRSLVSRQSAPRPVEVLAFPAVQLLDVAGPLQVFATANERGAVGTPYAPRVIAAGDLGLTASAGLRLVADPLPDLDAPLDTLVIAGGPGVLAACDDPALVAWVRARAARARRVASVCTGAFLLGRDRAPRRAPGRDPLDPVRRAGPALPAGPGRAGPDLRARRPGLVLRGGHRGHRPDAGAGGGGSRPSRRPGGGAPPRDVPQASRRTGAVQRGAGPAGRGGAVRARSTPSSPRTCRPTCRSRRWPRRPG